MDAPSHDLRFAHCGPSPDSDFDLRGPHVLPLKKVVGLEVREETIEQSFVVSPHPDPLPQWGEGGELEMAIVSHDVRKFFRLLPKKNGYVLEQVYSPLVVHTTPEHVELKAIACGYIPRHHSHHYFGFAETQWKLFLKGASESVAAVCDRRPHGADTAPLQQPVRRVKPLLYVYRVLLTGIHLMRTGEVEANLVTLNDEFRLPYIADLIARKLAGPEDLAVGQLLNDADVSFHQAEYERLRGELQAAHDASHLPELPSEETRAALNDLLVRVRLHVK